MSYAKSQRTGGIETDDRCMSWLWQLRPEKPFVQKDPGQAVKAKRRPPRQDLYGFCGNGEYCIQMVRHLKAKYNISSSILSLDGKFTGRAVFVCDGDKFLNNQWITTICDAMKHCFPEYILYPIQKDGDTALLYVRPQTGK